MQNNETKLLDYLKRATAELQHARARLAESEAKQHEPIAIVAMSCRFPGGVRTPEELWQLLDSGTDAISAFPQDRGWDLDALFDADPEARGKCYVREGGFLREADRFDAALFEVSPQEALSIDPQQRLLLETSWEALERAGIDPHSLHGSQTGVFVGVMYNDYGARLMHAPEQHEGNVAIGSAGSVASGRIAYTFGFQGPAVTVDTACSSSLVALHLACQALRRGECPLALAGGVTVMATPFAFTEFSRQRGLAPDGRCKAFSEAADGAGWSEGAGVLLLERLSDAQRLGHPILALVRGSAVNQDGRSQGLTAPNGPSQQRVIERALEDAQLGAGEIDAVEAHGTGTPLGDPIEAQALIETYGRAHSPEQPLWLGSIKSNIGHAQAAAGIAGVIKLVLALQERRLPRTLHAERPTSHVDWSAGTVRLLDQAQAWPERGRPLRAAVSSFGISGTNAHAILEQAPLQPALAPAPCTAHFLVFVLSARSEHALCAAADRLHARLVAQPGLALADVAHSLAHARALLEHRAIVVADTRDCLLEGLRALAAGQASPQVVVGRASHAGKIAFVFPGQGAQWPEMARELLEGSDAFRQQIEACAAAFAPHVDWSLLDVLRGAKGAPPFERVDVLQPALFATMLGLYALWRSLGITPDAVVGHSQGELAAACASGALSLEDAARVVTQRALALTALAGRSGLLAVELPEAELQARLEPFGARLSIAAINSPRASVAAGEPEALERLLEQLTAAGVFARYVRIDYASHSQYVEGIRDEVLRRLEPIRPRAAGISFYSTVTGDKLAGELLDAGHWYRSLRQTVRFAAAVQQLAADGHRFFIEVSPHPVHAMALEETFEAGEIPAVAVGTLRRHEGDVRRCLLSLAELAVHGLPVAWKQVLPPGRCVALPTYPFARDRYWIDAPAPVSAAFHAPAEASFWKAVDGQDLQALSSALGIAEPERTASLASLLPALSSWHRECQEQRLLDDLRYRVRWKPFDLPCVPALPGRWVFVVPAAAEHDERVISVAGALSDRGAEVRILPLGERAGMVERLRAAAEGTSLQGVLSWCTLDADSSAAEQVLGPDCFACTLGLVQSLRDAALRAPLWLLTQGAVGTEPADPLRHPEQALIWGIGRVIALEHPELWGGLLDLPDVLEPRALSLLAAALGGDCGEDQLALRRAGLYVRRLARAPLGESQAAVAWRPSGSVLITGGTGALGAHCARWLASRGAQHLVLLSRSGPAAPQATELTRELSELGARVSVLACDAADRAALAGVLNQLDAEGCRLDAVVHTAGTLDDAPATLLTPERMAAVLRPKVLAAQHLHELTRERALSAFVCFSSAAGVFGNFGQASYAAANAFLDALCEQRAALGLPATSIAWGAWAGSGMASADGVREGVRQHGIAPLAPARALQALQLALDQRDPTLTVADIDWTRLPALLGIGGRFLHDLREVRDALAAAPASQLHASPLLERLSGLNPDERARELLAFVLGETAAVLGHASAAELDPHGGFATLGLTSLMALALRQRLRRATGLPLAATLAFDHPTPQRMAAFLGDALGEQPRRDGAPARQRAATSGEDEPIAIIGAGLQLPGGAIDLDSLWRLLTSGVDAVTDMPAERWSAAEIFDPDPDARGKSYTQKGAFLPRIDGFDCEFFGISPREARHLDPQHRLLLHSAWHALESSGIVPASLKDSLTGVFVGIGPSEYQLLQAPGEQSDAYAVLGNHGSFAAGRLSFSLGLQGPALSVDTACSSSLVALHLASQSLRDRECDLALAAGVQLMASSDPFVMLSRTRALAPDGRCKTFSVDADGYGRGEGVVVLALERLSDARAHGRTILGVIRGSAINHDGESSGITAPNGASQQKLLRAALAEAHLAAADVDVVECHGTGTGLGDPIEVQALAAVYGEGHSSEQPLLIGALKTNIGHLESASGLAGVAKLLAALRHGALPATLHSRPRSPFIDWEALPVQVIDALRPWPARAGHVRRAGVSAFGLSGTNAHVILEEWVEPELSPPSAARAAEPPVLPIAISARSEAALQEQAAQLREHLMTRPGLSLGDVAYTLALHRSHFAVRAVVVAHDHAELLAELDALARGRRTERSRVDRASQGKLALLFTGQGSQRLGMGRELYASFEAFRRALDRVCAELDAQWSAFAGPAPSQPGGVASPSVRDVIFAEPSSAAAELLDQTAFTQTALFALEVALFELVLEWGVRPDLLIGHSIGELVAAHAGGVLSLADACKLVVARARLMQALPGGGAMVSLQASEAEVLPRLASARGRVDIAAINGPLSTVIAGDAAAVFAIADELEALGRKIKRLPVSHAFHSPHMDAMLDDFRQVAAGLEYRAPRIPIVSCLDGERASTEQLTSPETWVRHARRPVRWLEAVRTLERSGVTTYLELGAQPVLSALASDCLSDEARASAAFVPTLREGRSEAETLVGALGTLHARGSVRDLGAWFSELAPKRIELPGYAFSAERHWIETRREQRALLAAGHSATDHPLLGATLALAASDATVFSGQLSLAAEPWLAAHVVHGHVVFPGTASVELALAAGQQLGLEQLEELTLERPLVIPRDGSVQLQLSVAAPDAAGRRELSLHARAAASAPAAEWVRHARGTLIAASAFEVDRLDSWPPTAATPLALEGVYERLAEVGLAYGADFQGLSAAWSRGDELFAEVRLPEALRDAAAGYNLHPALFDAALHVLALGSAGSGPSAVVPFAWRNVSLQRAGASSLRVHIARTGPDGTLRLRLADGSGAAVASVESLVVRQADSSLANGAGLGADALYRVEWEPLVAATGGPSDATARALIELDDPEWAAALAASDPSWTRYANLEALQAGLDRGAAPPDCVLVPFGRSLDASAAPPAERAHDALQRALAFVQRWLADERLAECKLVARTSSAVATRAGERVADLAHAPLWGFLRSVQSEHPERALCLLDLDRSPASQAALAGALLTSEAQIALREGTLLAPRLSPVRAGADTERALPAQLDPQGTVLITGGTGTLGALLARHLIAEHGARQLILSSRQGLAAEGARALLEELSAAGANVRIVACDCSDRAALAQLLQSIAPAHPLTAVIHTAGVVDDGMVTSLTPERLDRVLSPKLDAALHLHELTQALDLSMFVLFSSLAGVLGARGQSNYAAANSFLDALAHERSSQGSRAKSLAWGAWAQRSGVTRHLSEADMARIARAGVQPLSTREGLALFDAALGRGEPVLAPVRLDLAALAAQPAPSPLLQGLLRGARRRQVGTRSASSASLRRRLDALPELEREAQLLALVREEVASVLGHEGAQRIERQRPLQELGLDSLMAVELRNRLSGATGVRMPATVLFDHPTPAALVQLLQSELFGAASPAAASQPAPATASSASEPIAIVAMSCRYPGGVSSPEELWQLLATGGDGICPFPQQRGWDVDALYDPDPEVHGKSYTREGGFLPDADLFDPGFFGISPREALAIDPQQRLLLETAWEAFERAGVDPEALYGSATGVFVGVAYQDYGSRLTRIPRALEGQVGIGSAGSVASGRIAYTFGLQGPAVTIDTACSSSLVTLHLACQSLRQRECSLALAGGVAVMATPGTFVEFSRQRALAPDGRCKAFSAEANGTGWGEGVGLLLLERLSDAQRHGHPILGLVRGSAVNQDGKSQGLTAPSGPAQQRVILQALQSAQLTAADVDVVEAHGTGTNLGDPIEAQALIATYGKQRSPERPLWLGSIKSNIGHAQAAAGAAGVIKVLLSMQHGLLPKTLHAERPSPHIDWSEGSVRLLQSAQPFAPNGHPRRAGVSSFSISGTNAHVILEEAPPLTATQPSAPSAERVLPLPLSAKSEAALRAQAARLREHLERHPELELPDVAYSLATLRAHFERRAVIVAADRARTLEALDALAGARSAPQLVLGHADLEGKVVFVFPGQGAQWEQMAVALLDSEPAFREQMLACERALAPYVSWSLLSVLRGQPGAPKLERDEVVQPALFSVMVSLAALWRAKGVEPDAVVGHSQGELAAAHVCGALSLEDCAKVVALRSQALAELAGHGGMLAVELPEAELATYLQAWPERLSVAALNGPRTTVVCGDLEALQALHGELARAQVFARTVKIEYASHSAQVERIRAKLEQRLAGIQPRAGHVPFYSTVQLERLDGSELNADYWYRNLRHSVRFAPAIEQLLANGHRFFIEVSPHPVLTIAIEATFEAQEKQAVVVGSLRRNEGGPERFLASLAELTTRGLRADWRRILPPARRVPLPTYAFQRERYWIEAGSGPGDVTTAGLSAADHPLLSAAVPLADSDAWLLTGRLSLRSHAWLAGHAVFGTVILPGTAFIELALTAAQRVGLDCISELTLQAPLPLPSEGAVQLQVSVGAPDAEGARPVAIYARAEAAEDAAVWTRHASGLLSRPPAEVPSAIESWPPAEATAIDLEGFYARLAQAGLEYGEAFQGVRAAWQQADALFAEVELAPSCSADAARFGVHPALLDAVLHTLALRASAREAALPFSFSGVSLHTSGASALRVCVRQDALMLADSTGAPVLSIERCVVRPVPSELSQARRSGLDALYRVHWPALATSDGRDPVASERWAALCDAETASALALQAELHADLGALGRELAAGRPAPEALIVPCLADTALSPEAAYAATQRALALLQTWLADERLAACRLVLVTRDAVAAGSDEPVHDLVHAPLWGFVRSVQSEYADRAICLVDLDRSEASARALGRAIRCGESQLAIRKGELRVPRLTRARGSAGSPRPLDPNGTVLITGGTGSLGALLARHLVHVHGARRLLLTSRQGPAAASAGALQAELAAAGAEVVIAACDAAERGALQQLLAAIPAEHALTAVIHAAGTLDDGVVSALTPERMQRVMRPKLAAALHLHELTRELDLRAFVLFSSAAGVLGGPGQSNYAAANSFLDALAQHRRAQGLAASSLAWGYWAERSSMTHHLSDADVARLARAGIGALSSETGLALFDAALASEEAALVPIQLTPALLAGGATVPPILRELVRTPADKRGLAPASTSASQLLKQLAALSEADRVRALLELVRRELAHVLALPQASAAAPDRPVQELGLDSLMALELRNRLSAATGLRLPSTLLFEHPTPQALAELLAEELRESGSAAERADLLAGLARLESSVTALADEGLRDQVVSRLQGLLARWAPQPNGAELEATQLGPDVVDADDDALFQLIEEKLKHRGVDVERS